MRELYIIGNSDRSVYLSSYKNSIVRRVPYRNSCNLIFNTVRGSGEKYISPMHIKRYFNAIQLKICKVS